MGPATRHTQIPAGAGQGGFLEEVFELGFEALEFPVQMRARKAFLTAGRACGLEKELHSLRRPRTVVIKGTAEEAEEAGGLLRKGLDCHNLDFIVQMSGQQRS